jgi:tRNA G26 N,N-dimethylase Trm1
VKCSLVATYLVGVVKMHNAVLRRHVLVALALAAHHQRRVHVHVMAGEIQTDQALENHRVRGLRSGKEDQQASGRAAISDHVEDGAEASGLLELARGHAVQRIEEAADGVEEAAAARVEGHEVEGAEG